MTYHDTPADRARLHEGFYDLTPQIDLTPPEAPKPGAVVWIVGAVLLAVLILAWRAMA